MSSRAVLLLTGFLLSRGNKESKPPAVTRRDKRNTLFKILNVCSPVLSLPDPAVPLPSPPRPGGTRGPAPRSGPRHRPRGMSHTLNPLTVIITDIIVREGE